MFWRLNNYVLQCSDQVINAVVPAKYLDDKTVYHLQPSGRFVIGGPQVTMAHKLPISLKVAQII